MIGFSNCPSSQTTSIAPMNTLSFRFKSLFNISFVFRMYDQYLPNQQAYHFLKIKRNVGRHCFNSGKI